MQGPQAARTAGGGYPVFHCRKGGLDHSPSARAAGMGAATTASRSANSTGAHRRQHATARPGVAVTRRRARPLSRPPGVERRPPGRLCT